MEEKDVIDFSHLSENLQVTPKYIVNLLFNKVHPLIHGIQKKINLYKGDLGEEIVVKVQDVYMLCSHQIKKCFIYLFHIFQVECTYRIFLQESRYCVLERISWCIKRLVSIEDSLQNSCKTLTKSSGEDVDNSILVTTMYFVNWIDHTFEMLTNLSEVINKDFKSETFCHQWKKDVVEYVSSLYVSIDELLLSAMTLCRYCLESDQHIIKARCQVVLRETKALFKDLITGEPKTDITLTEDCLKLPINTSNVNVQIDVLKDVLYALETNTNTALLGLLVYCFSNNMTAVDILKEHVENGNCSCHLKSDSEEPEDCPSVKEFDLYNERLIQIGSFAVSCSSDHLRILSVRSGLATLEALDPHLVPALMMSPDSHHAKLLVDSWNKEVREIRDGVFLIVDPAAFADKSKQAMHQTLLDIIKRNIYCNADVCKVINIGCVVYDFFQVYIKCEPDALPDYDKLAPLLADLSKVQMECKIVSNHLCTGDDVLYDIKKFNNKDITFAQMLKRLKLLYTLVNRINSLLHPKENDELFAEFCEDEQKNLTHTVNVINNDTFIHSPRVSSNISRSIFARTANIRCSTKNFPLLKLTKHMRAKNFDELNFSAQLDELVYSGSKNKGTIIDKQMEVTYVREQSVLYFSSVKNRSSLRKAVLDRQSKITLERNAEEFMEHSDMNDTMSLQITDVINQLNNLTMSDIKGPAFDTTHVIFENDETTENNSSNNVLRLDINNANTRRVWNIPVNPSVDMPLDETAGTVNSNVTLPSNVTTLERISDLDLVESKLSNLKSQFETSL